MSLREPDKFFTTESLDDSSSLTKAETALGDGEVWLAAQMEAFQAAVRGAPLDVALGILARAAAKQWDSGVRCAFYMVNRDGTELHHVSGMAESYAECVDGFKVGSDSLACGLAVHTGCPVITPNVLNDPLWQPWLWLAKEYDFRGCWSFPVETEEGRVVGTLALYFPAPRQASPQDLEAAAILTRAAAIIISRYLEGADRGRIARKRGALPRVR